MLGSLGQFASRGPERSFAERLPNSCLAGISRDTLPQRVEQRVPAVPGAIVPAQTKAVAYLRVSTEKQADKGVSLEAQRAKVDAYAQLYELELVDVVSKCSRRGRRRPSWS